MNLVIRVHSVISEAQMKFKTMTLVGKNLKFYSVFPLQGGGCKKPPNLKSSEPRTF
jgi:hypothetical protein